MIMPNTKRFTNAAFILYGILGVPVLLIVAAFTPIVTTIWARTKKRIAAKVLFISLVMTAFLLMVVLMGIEE